MSNTDKLREIAKRYGGSIVVGYGQPSGSGSQLVVTAEEQLFSDLTALISEGYVEKAKYDDAVRQRDELREALADMVSQFAYRGTYEGRENLHTGGLSALESAFDALGLSDPITVLDFEAAIKNTEG